MNGLRVVDLIDLALAIPDAPEVRVEKTFDWYFAREMEIVKWPLGAALVIFISLFEMRSTRTSIV